MESKKISLRDFLVKFTAISTKFIDEYLSFYYKTLGEPFGIELQEIMDYLEIKSRDSMKKRLRSMFTSGVDYIEKIIAQKLTQGNSNVLIYITFETFQKICMMSRSRKANKVRDYYIMLFKFIEYYRHEISEVILEKIVNGAGCIYIIFVKKGNQSENDLLKIGRSYVEKYKGRMGGYQTGHLHPDIRFVLLVKDPLRVENCTKAVMKNTSIEAIKKFTRCR